MVLRVLAAGALLVGCGRSTTAADSGGPVDSGSADGGAPEMDGGLGDGGAGPDGGGIDAGTVPDSGFAAGDFYVATDGRDDAGWSGTLAAPNGAGTDGPFASVPAAQLAVQGLKAAQPTRSSPIVVLIRGGTYFLSAALSFGSGDSGPSGTVPVVYQAYPGEVPVLSGGVPVTGWTHGAQNRWTAPVDSTQTQPFEQLYVNGTRRMRPRTTPSSYLYNAGPVYVADAGACPSALADAGVYECFDRFYFTPGDMDAGWTNLGASYPPGDIEIDDFENFTMPLMRLKAIDPAQSVAYLTGSTNPNPVQNGFFKGHRYLVDNVLDALNQPGQWFLDRSANPWMLTYLAEASETDLNTAQVIAPQLGQLMTGQNLANVTFAGLTFSHAGWVVPPTGHTARQAEPDTPAALTLSSPTNVVFEGCTFSHLGGWALELVGAANNNQILDGVVTDVGAGGIRVGLYPKAGDTDANIPQHNLVQNNIVTGTGRSLPTGGGVAIWLGNSHHNTVTHNEVYDSYGGGLGNLTPSGSPHIAHDNTFSFNHVHDINRGIMRDGGAMYLATLTNTGNQVLNNRIHDVWADPGTAASPSYGGWCVYLDNGTSNVLVQNNLAYRCGAETFFNHDGTANTYTNNIFAFGRLAQMQNGAYTAAQLTFTATHNLFYFDLGPVQAKNPWYCFGQACSTIFAFDDNLYWNVSGAAPTFRTSDTTGRVVTNYSFAQWQSTVGEDVHSVNADPQFTDAGYPADDYSLQPGSPALTGGLFVPFDTTAPGRLSTGPVPPVVPDGFPLQLPANPATAF